MNDKLDAYDERKIGSIINQIASKKDIENDLIEYEKNLINRIRSENPEIFDQLGDKYDNTLNDSLNFIIQKFNKTLQTGGSLISEFNKIEIIAVSKKLNMLRSSVKLEKN